MAMAVKEKGRNSMRDLLIAFQKKKARKNGNIESSFFVDIIALKTKHLFFVFHRVVKWQKMSSSVFKSHEILSVNTYESKSLDKWTLGQ